MKQMPTNKFDEELIHDGLGIVLGHDTGRIIATFNHESEAEIFCELSNHGLYEKQEVEQEPLRYLVERFIDGVHERDDYFKSKESAFRNAECGYNETKVTPLYTTPQDQSARITELEAQLAECVKALESLVIRCEMVNERCLDQIGMGLIDLNMIANGKATLEKVKAK